MANTLLTSSVIAKASLANLYPRLVMAGLVHRDYSPEFQAKVGNTITVRKPATFTAQEFTTAISVQNATETGVTVTLNHHADVSFQVTSADMALNVQDFSAQFLAPAMEALAQKLDQDLLVLKNQVAQEVGVAGGATTGVSGTNQWDWDNPRVSIDADRVLNARNVPTSERYIVVGPTTKARWIGDDLFTRADQRGDTDGLRDAYLGAKIYGFEPYMDQNVNEADEVSLAFHRTAFALVTRPLVLPDGAGYAAYESYKGLGLRVVKDYTISSKTEVVSIDMLYGCAALDVNRAVTIYGNAS